MPAQVGSEGAELAEGVNVGFSPRGVGRLEAGLADVAVAAFDQAGGVRRGERAGAGAAELVGAVVQITQRARTAPFFPGTSCFWRARIGSADRALGARQHLAADFVAVAPFHDFGPPEVGHLAATFQFGGDPQFRPR